jgi:hypothetical protein
VLTGYNQKDLVENGGNITIEYTEDEIIAASEAMLANMGGPNRYVAAHSNLSFGGPLQAEVLDLAGLGMYDSEQRDNLIAAGAAVDDFVETGYTNGGKVMYKRLSEKGVKWNEFQDTEIKLHKALVRD